MKSFVLTPQSLENLSHSSEMQNDDWMHREDLKG